jgi:transposase
MRVEAEELLHAWSLDLEHVRERLYTAPQARERERWHALWLLGQGWTQEHIAQALGHDAHTIGHWIEGFRQRGPSSLQETAHGGAPPPSRTTNKRP